eukprot:NODE_1238_length_2053_cov_45.344041_g1047_i0.p1 GENE.NODE_1238_length_2053_cov_45.344041_g1047_i0~~NODE_1238_length_2053_cov_45.344041_g1047_i0.p1  ORF type:complete len:430 (-),score=79.49 NODE_1238_length_2053_cov_45.344041_g1047_i0:28-1317(-)
MHRIEERNNIMNNIQLSIMNKIEGITTNYQVLFGAWEEEMDILRQKIMNQMLVLLIQESSFKESMDRSLIIEAHYYEIADLIRMFWLEKPEADITPAINTTWSTVSSPSKDVPDDVFGFDYSQPSPLIQLACKGSPVSSPVSVVPDIPDILCVTVMNDSILTGDDQGVVKQWSTKGEFIGSFTAHRGSVISLCCLNGWLWSSGDDGEIHIWAIESESYSKQRTLLEATTTTISLLDFNSESLLSIHNQILRLRSPLGSNLLTLDCGQPIRCACQVGHRLLTVGENTIDVWDVEHEKKIGQLIGHTKTVLALAEYKGNLVSVDNGGLIIEWIVESCTIKRTIANFEVGVYGATFCNDHLYLICSNSSSEFNSVQISLQCPNSALAVQALPVQLGPRIYECPITTIRQDDGTITLVVCQREHMQLLSFHEV